MINKIIAWVNKSLGKRMLIILILMISVQIVLTGAVGYRWIFLYMESILDAKAGELNQSLVQEINYIRGNYEKQADGIMANQTVQDVLSKEYSDAAAYNPDPEDRKAVEWALMDPDNTILSVLIGKKNLYQSRTATNPYISYERISAGEPYARATAGDGANVWAALREDISAKDGSPTLYLCKTIKLIQYDFRTLGHLIMQIPFDELRNVFDQWQLVKHEYFAVVDERGRYVYHTMDAGLIGETLEDSLRDATDAPAGIKETVNAGDGQLTIYYTKYSDKTGKPGWNIIHAVPTEVTAEYAKLIRDLVLGIMLVLLALSAPLALILFNGITGPIIRLKNAVAAFGNALTLRVKVDRQDEIGSLQESFNKMADDIEKLMAEKDEDHRRMRELELSALEYQVNPHFLYNSLDSIYWMARKAGAPDVAEMIRAMAGFFRIGLSRGRKSYYVKDELEHVRQYLIINKIRFKDSFEYGVSAEADILDYPVINIILQPIVENAIKYGIDRSGGNKSLIEISGRDEDGFIVFTVKDDGPGIPPDRLRAIEGSLADSSYHRESENGFGLHYVAQRLRLYYGANARVSVENIYPRGVAVKVYIPKI